MTQGISEEARKALDKAIKVLEMAQRKEGNEAEAAVATAKFNEILQKYNLDTAAIEQSRGERSGKREEAKLAGGVYLFQRRLWAWAAELNFCLYWTMMGAAPREVRRKNWAGKYRVETEWRKAFWHRVVGRTINIKATQVLAEYLETAIERVVMEAVGGENTMRFSRYAMSMREGMSDRLCEKMAQRRRELLAEDERQRHEQAEAARAAAREGVSTSTSITLTNYAQAERDANMDHLYGEGWSAKQAARRAEEAREEAEAEAEYARWAAENPEEARRQEREQEERMKKHRPRRSSGSSEDRKMDWGAYYRGRDEAEDIGLDTQVGIKDRVRIGGGR